jgi:hypothetical protein
VLVVPMELVSASLTLLCPACGHLPAYCLPPAVP